MSTNKETKGTFYINTVNRTDAKPGECSTAYKTVTSSGLSMKLEDWQTMLEGVFQHAEEALAHEFELWADRHNFEISQKLTLKKFESFWNEVEHKLGPNRRPITWLPDDHMVVDQVSFLETQFASRGYIITDSITEGASIKETLVDSDGDCRFRISFGVTVTGHEVSQSTGKIMDRRKTTTMEFWTDPKTGRACFESSEMRRARKVREKAEAQVLEWEAGDVKKAFGEEVAKNFLNLPKDAKLATYKAAKQHLEHM